MVGEKYPVLANVILYAPRKQSVVATRRTLTPKNVQEFLPGPEGLKTVSRELAKFGFQIGPDAETHVGISGTQEQFQEVFHVRLTKGAEERGRPPYYVPTTDKPPRIPDHLSDVIETIRFPRPLRYHTSPMPPVLRYYHLRVPDDIARGMDVLRVHASKITGAGVKLAIVDSGFMTPWHPYYMNRGYNINPVVSDPRDPESKDDDPQGHGTAIAACALAVAPGATLTVYKVYLYSYADAFAMAVAGGPHIISCSWDTEFDEALHLAVNHAVSKGIVVVFSCGNAVGKEGPVGWPGCEPAVISVGGVFIRPDGGIEASDYASSGNNNQNEPGRQVPDLCGIVGQIPYGRLIPLPTPPGSDADVKGSSEGQDGTAQDDGWVVESGTSAAAPMVAGVAALLMEADSSTVGDPVAIKARLEASCLEVTTGKSASGERAGLATGAGLVQAYPAISGGGGTRGLDSTTEGGMKKMGAHGGKKRIWLLLRVHNPVESAVKLHNLALEQQWSSDWSIKRIDTVHEAHTGNLPKFKPPHDSSNLFVAIEAVDDRAVEIGFYKIQEALQDQIARAQNPRDPHGHVLSGSSYLDWS